MKTLSPWIRACVYAVIAAIWIYLVHGEVSWGLFVTLVVVGYVVAWISDTRQEMQQSLNVVIDLLRSIDYNTCPTMEEMNKRDAEIDTIRARLKANIERWQAAS